MRDTKGAPVESIVSKLDPNRKADIDEKEFARLIGDAARLM